LSNTKLQSGQIQLGKPLPFDAFDAEGKLLLRRGVVIDSQHQLDGLVERGLYRDFGTERMWGDSPDPTQADLVPGFTARPVARKVSVFEQTAQLQKQLEALLTAPPEGLFVERVQHLAERLQYAFKLDSDAALATIQVQHEGRYAMRRLMHGAILIELLMAQAGGSEGQRRVVICAALTMNIAMLDLQDELYHQAAPPSPEQKALVRNHATQGVAMLRELGVANESWLSIVAQHHETIDGQGYPLGLVGAQISRPAQLLSLADRYGAMATGRGYRAAALPNVVLKQIFMDKDKGVDAGLASLLVKAVGIYPPGSLVELANGDIAVVVKRTQSASQPVVRCVKTYRKEILEQPRKRLTSEPAYAITRLIPMAQLGFELNPALLWDEGFEVDAL
jgi:hypothetical protein